MIASGQICGHIPGRTAEANSDVWRDTWTWFDVCIYGRNAEPHEAASLHISKMGCINYWPAAGQRLGNQEEGRGGSSRRISCNSCRIKQDDA